MQKNLSIGFEEALTRVPEALSTEGFGVLTEIDVQATLKKKLDVDTRRYRILGACNPPFARDALAIDPRAGLMMPCNVAVYEDDEGRAVVLAVKPSQSAAATGNPQLIELAEKVEQKLARALSALD
jgi:uncharacterized protein (DUF302 family)